MANPYNAISPQQAQNTVHQLQAIDTNTNQRLDANDLPALIRERISAAQETEISCKDLFGLLSLSESQQKTLQDKGLSPTIINRAEAAIAETVYKNMFNLLKSDSAKTAFPNGIERMPTELELRPIVQIGLEQFRTCAPARSTHR